MFMQTLTFTVDGDHYQFYLEDMAMEANTGDMWHKQAHTNRLDVLPGLIAVGTSHYGGPIPVVVEVHPQQPSNESLELWDHVVECSIKVRSGQLSLTSPITFDTDAPTFFIAPDSYRARIYYGNLDSVRDDIDMEGEDHYRIVLWPGVEIAPHVIKRKPVLEESEDGRL
jgi:hypothetical protein